MRKKYLSALLFGALLLASAGTFTSCKDYDDDIKNLQEQINTVKTSLDELTTKVNSLGAGVKEFKYENGKLILVTDKDTNFEVELPACEGITNLEIKNGILYADGVEVGPIGGEGTTIEGDKVEVKDGILYINGEAQDLKDEVGNKVAVTDNGSTYILTVDGVSYVLPKASTSVSLAILGQTAPSYNYFTNLSKLHENGDIIAGAEGGIQWGTADKYRGNWGGLKPVEKGKLLVGQISTVKVRALAADFDLSTAKLTLVNTMGEEAPVVVTPIAEGKQGPAIDNSRAADQNGVWDLNIEMKSSVTAENIDVAFAAKDVTDSYKYKNVKYAVAVDGQVATDYEIYVDTREEKAALDFTFNGSVNLAFKENGLDRELFKTPILDETAGEKAMDGTYPFNGQSLAVKVPIGTTTTLYLTPEGTPGTAYHNSIDYVYDSYIEILDKDLAEAKGIEANGMDLKVSEDAKALDGLRVKLHVLDVNGNETKSQVLTLNFASATATGEAIADQTYTVMPSTKAGMEFILVDLGNTFTSLTADEADKISKALASGKTGRVTWYSTTDNKVFDLTGNVVEGGLKKIDLSDTNYDILYYAKKEDALKYGLNFNEKYAISFDKYRGTINTEASTIREIAYAVIPVSSIQNEALPNTQAPFSIVLEDGDDNELKKVSANLTLTVPEFDDVLVANSEQNLWIDGVFNTRVIATGVGNGNITLEKAYKSKADANGVAYIDINTTDSRLVYDLAYVDLNEDAQYVDDMAAVSAKPLTGTIVKDGKLMHDIDVTATLYPMGTQYKNFKTTKSFDVYLKSVFEDATLSYYGADGKPVTGPMTLEDYKYIYSGEVAANGTKTGLFVNFDGETHYYWFDSELGLFTNGPKIMVSNSITDTKPNNMTPSGANDKVKPYIYLGDGATGVHLTQDNINNRGRLVLDNVAGGTSGTVVFTFVDNMGVQTEASIAYKK